MKKCLSFLLLLVLGVLPLLGLTSCFSGGCGVCDDMSHEVEDGVCTQCDTPECTPGLALKLQKDGTYVVTGIGSCKDDDIVIGIYNGISVTAIEVSAFRNNTTLESVTIGNCVKEIKRTAFYGCSALEMVYMGEQVSTVDAGAFDSCNSLKGVYITDIGSWCGIEFDAITSNPLFYADRLYLNGGRVTSLDIPNYVTEIKDYAFVGAYDIMSVTIGDNLTNIGESAFYDCANLSSVTIGSGVTNIGKSAFKNTSLSSAKFKVFDGWRYANGSSSGSFYVTDIQNPVTAARFLSDSYSAYYWSR